MPPTLCANAFDDEISGETYLCGLPPDHVGDCDHTIKLVHTCVGTTAEHLANAGFPCHACRLEARMNAE